MSAYSILPRWRQEIEMGFDEQFKIDLKNDVRDLKNIGLNTNEIAKTLRQSPEQIEDIEWSLKQ